MADEDLFGDAVIPRRGTADYERHIASLPLPMGLKYEQLSKQAAAPGAPDWVQCVWARDDQGTLWHLVIDGRTGEKYKGKGP